MAALTVLTAENKPFVERLAAAIDEMAAGRAGTEAGPS